MLSFHIMTRQLKKDVIGAIKNSEQIWGTGKYQRKERKQQMEIQEQGEDSKQRGEEGVFNARLRKEAENAHSIGKERTTASLEG